MVQMRSQCDPLGLYNCPASTVNKTLDQYSGSVFFDPPIYVADQTGLRRSIELVYEPKTTLFWWSDHHESQHNIQVTASSWSPKGHLDTKVCTYGIQVIG